MRTDHRWNLTLFGTLRLHRVDATGVCRIVPLCHQSAALLAHLALARGGTRSREELAHALWDETADERSGSLSTALWRLRQTLESAPFAAGDVLRTTRDGQVGLSADAPLRVDVDEYLRDLLPPLAVPIESLDSTGAARLASAVTAYAGDLLQGVHDTWALREREKLRRLQIDALRRLLQWCEREGDVGAGIGHALAILELDELREDIHRELMRLYMQAGLRALALRQYERCRGALKRELAIVPMPQTMALYQQIVDNAVGRGAQASAEPTPRVDPPLAQASQAARTDAPTDLAERVGAARRHLAAADAQLLRALPRTRRAVVLTDP